MTDRLQQIHRRVLPQPAPAAGANFSITANTGNHWRILGMLFTLTTSAVAANRHVNLAMGDGTTTSWRATAAADQAASLAITYELLPFVPDRAPINGLAYIGMPYDGLWLPKGWTLAITTAAIDVADQYSAISVDIQEIPDGPDYSSEPSMPLNTVLLDQ